MNDPMMISDQVIKNAAQRGSIFFTLFASVAMIGVIGAVTVSFIRGPLATSVKVTRQNAAEIQLSMGMRLVAVASATQQALSLIHI